MDVEAPSSYLQSVSSKKAFKWTTSHKSVKKSLNESLSSFYGKYVQDFTLKKRTQLHNEAKEPKTIQVDLSFDNSETSFDVGDHLSIYPRNRVRDVEFLKSRLKDNPEAEKLVTLQVSVDRRWENLEDFPGEISYDDLLYNFLDINIVPSQEILEIFAFFASDPKEKIMLTELAQDELIFNDWVGKRKSICETLNDFGSVLINSATLLSHLSLLKPRRYSIASSPKGNNLSLVVGVVEYQTTDNIQKTGLTSGNLNEMSLETKIPGFIKYESKVHFGLPEDPSWPIIMIAAGSGIAPFRGFWMKRYDQQKDGYVVGKTVLYYGCRKKSMDLLKHETDPISKTKQSTFKWLKPCKSGRLMDFEREVALSREPGQKKQYVQSLIMRDAEKVYELWQKKGGYIYICGKVQMAEEVCKALLDILTHYGNMDKTAAMARMEDMKRLYRYQEDIFTSNI